MRRLPIEHATDQADIPHRFLGGERPGCEVCTHPQTHPLHEAWEKAQVNEREQASHTGLQRELGT